MPPKRSFKRFFRRDDVQRMFVDQLVRQRRGPQPEPEPEPEPAPTRWHIPLDAGARYLAGAAAVGISGYVLRGAANHMSREAVSLLVSSAFCLCGAAAAATAYTDTLTVGSQDALREAHNPEWISDLITQLWPHIQATAVEIKDAVIEPMVQQSVPSLRFTEFGLGDHTPQIAVREVHSRGTGRGITLQMEVAWTSQSKISMVVGHAIPFGVRSIACAGTLYVVMHPITLEPPIVGAVHAYFIDKPHLRLHYTGAAALARMPGLERAIERAIDDCIASMIVLPNRMSFPIAAGLDMAEISSPPPIGILWVRPVRAEHVLAGDTHLLSANSSDPYVVIELGKQRYRSKTISNTLNPVWEEDDGLWLLVSDMNQSFKLEVFDEDTLSSDDLIGVIQPRKLTELLVSEDQCQSQAIYNAALELPLHPEKPSDEKSWDDMGDVDAGNIALDMKWCPVLLFEEQHGNSSPKTSRNMQPHRLRRGMRALVAIKIHTIAATLHSSNEARVGVFLSDGSSACTGPAQNGPLELSTQQHLVFNTVLYLPIEFNPETKVSIQMLINKAGANVDGIGSSSSMDSQSDRAHALEVNEPLGPEARAPDTPRSSRFLSMEARTMSHAKKVAEPRTLTLEEVNRLAGPLCTIDDCTSNGWLTESLMFTPATSERAPSQDRYATTNMMDGEATATISLRLYSCGLVA